MMTFLCDVNFNIVYIIVIIFLRGSKLFMQHLSTRQAQDWHAK